MSEDMESYSNTLPDLNSPDPERMTLAHQVWGLPRPEEERRVLQAAVEELPYLQTVSRTGLPALKIRELRQRLVKQSASL